MVTLGDGIKGVELVPLNVLNREVRLQPRVLNGRRGEAVIGHLNNLSREFGTRIATTGGRYYLEM